MRQKWLLFLLALLPWMAEAKTISVNNGVIYLFLDTDTKTASLTSHPDKYNGDVVIPESITYQDVAYKVVQIGWRAFEDCKGLTSVTIPNSVSVIFDDAFKNCSGLKSIEIPNSVTKIGNTAFSGCTGLTSVTIPASVKTLGGSVFERCKGLTSASIYCETGSSSIFSNCDNLKDVFFDCENVYSFFSSYAPVEKVTFGNHVKTIKENAFSYCRKLKSVDFSDSITAIEKNAFYYCDGLTSITIPSGIAKIGKDAFNGCSSLTEVCISDLTAWCNIAFENEYASPIVYGKKLVLNGKEITNLVIPDGVTTIPKAAFANGVGFKTITIPKSVLSISDYAFDGCTALKSIVIPDGVASIGISAFGNCDALERITIASSVKSIGSKAFYKCKSLKVVNIPDIAAWCQTQFDGEYSNPSYYAKSLYVNGELLTKLVVPEGVTIIKGYAFVWCMSIESARFPSSLTEIENYAFYYCENLSEIYSMANIAPSLKDRTFYGVSTYKLTLYIQESSKESYQTAYWWRNLYVSTIPDNTPMKCAKPTVGFEDGKLVFRCETKGVEFVSQILDDNVTAHTTSSIPLKPKYTVRVFARIKGSEDSDITTAEFEWNNDNPQITYIK